MTKLTPDSFKLPIIEEVYRLRQTATRFGRTHELDPKTSMWVIRIEAWEELIQSRDLLTYGGIKGMSGRSRNELLGLPVRLTVDDAPDVPMIQLVMEPETKPRFSPPLRKA